jgi:hypothetical protein
VRLRSGSDAATPQPASRRLGLRPEKRASGDRLTTPAPARVFRKPVHHRLGTQPSWRIVAKQRLRGSPRLQRIFRAVAAGWPHRAAEPMWHRRETRAPYSKTIDSGHPLPRAACRYWLAEDLGAGDAPRSRKTGGAIRRGEFRRCDPRSTTQPPAHQCAWHVSHTRTRTRRGSERQREYERRPFSRPRKRDSDSQCRRAAVAAAESPARAQVYRLTSLR